MWKRVLPGQVAGAEDYSNANNVLGRSLDYASVQQEDSPAPPDPDTADLALTVSVDDGSPKQGDTVVYTLVLTNNGPEICTGIEVTDSLPSGVTYSANSPEQGVYSPVGGVWTLGTVSPSTSRNLTIDATVDDGTADTTIVNTGTITAHDITDPVAGNDSDTASINVTPLFNIYMEITETYTQTSPAQWNDYVASKVAKGANWLKWYNLIESRVTTRGGSPGEVTNEGVSPAQYSPDDTSAPYVRFWSHSVHDLASMAHMVNLASHTPPQEALDKIREISNMSTKVGFNWGQYESAVPSTIWRASGQPFRDIATRTSMLTPWKTISPISYSTSSGDDEYSASPIHAVDVYEDRVGGKYNYHYDPWRSSPLGAESPNYSFGDSLHRGGHVVHIESDRSINFWQMVEDRGFLSPLDPRMGSDPLTYAQAMVEAYELWVNEYYSPAGKPDHYAYDQVYNNLTSAKGQSDLTDPWGGTGGFSTSPWTQSRYDAGWLALFNAHAAVHGSPSSVSPHPFIWGNADWRGSPGDRFPAGVFRGRYIEHFFTNENGSGPASPEYIKQKLTDGLNNGCHLIIGMQNAGSIDPDWYDENPGSPGPAAWGWEDLYNHVASLGNDAVRRVYVQCCRTELDGYLYWNKYIVDPADFE